MEKKKVHKRKRTHKRLGEALPLAAHSKRVKRFKHRKRGGMLGDLFTPESGNDGMKSVISGAVGGAACAVIERLLKGFPVKKEWQKSGLLLIAGFALSTLGKSPRMGAAISGVAVYKMIRDSNILGLGDEGDTELTKYAEELEKLPLVISEDGEQYLQDAYQVGYAPSFAQ